MAEENLREALQYVRELTGDEAVPLELEGQHFLYSRTPSGTITVHEFESALAPLRLGPKRIRSTQEFVDVDSFATYLKRFGATMIDSQNEIYDGALLTASLDKIQVVAVLDYHKADATAWGDHKAVLVSKRTPEWKELKDANRKYVSQSTFAQYLDRYSSWVVSPDAAELAESVMQMEGVNNSSWSSKVNRANGSYKFSVQEDVLTTVEIPQVLKLNMAPFYHSEEVAVTAKIRFTIGKDGTPTFALEVDNLEKIEYDALQLTFTAVRVATGLPVLVGP